MLEDLICVFDCQCVFIYQGCSFRVAHNGRVLGEEALTKCLIEYKSLKLVQMSNRNTEGLFCKTCVLVAQLPQS